MKKCIYCKQVIDENSVIDFCEKCGKGVWGERMFNAIVKNMEQARTNGDLNQGIITQVSGKISENESGLKTVDKSLI